jgi:hypothetical protein
MKNWSKLVLSFITLFVAGLSGNCQNQSPKDSLGGATVPTEIDNPEIIGLIRNRRMLPLCLMPI